MCILHRMFATRALIVLQTAMYLTSHSACLTGFCEPFSLSYRRCTSMKNVKHDCCYCIGHLYTFLLPDMKMGIQSMLEIFSGLGS